LTAFKKLEKFAGNFQMGTEHPVFRRFSVVRSLFIEGGSKEVLKLLHRAKRELPE